MATEVAADSLGEEWKVRVRKMYQVQSSCVSFPVDRVFCVTHLAGMLKASCILNLMNRLICSFLSFFFFLNPHLLDCFAGFLNSILLLIWVPYQHSRQMKTVPQKP